jgi:hypothetical protein
VDTLYFLIKSSLAEVSVEILSLLWQSIDSQMGDNFPTYNEEVDSVRKRFVHVVDHLKQN